MGKQRREIAEQSRVPNVVPPFTMRQATDEANDEVLEEQLRLDEASREEPPLVERIIDSEAVPPDSDGLAQDERP